MKQSIAFLLSLCLTPAWADNYIVSTPHTSLVVTADKGKGLGMELQPSQMSKEDFNFAKRGIAAYKQIRDVVQMGDLYRLHAPYEGDGVASLIYVSEDKSLAAFFAYNYNYLINQKIPAVLLGGLDPDRNYRIKDLTPWDVKKACSLDGKVISGKTLMEVGLNLRSIINYNDASVALELVAE